MSYDLFVSYSRRDNEQGRITQLVDRIRADYLAFAGRPLVAFLDVHPEHGIQGMEDWQLKILGALHESRLFLACLSPAYLRSLYCKWEVVEYLKQEIGRAHFGDGIAPVYFVDVPAFGGPAPGERVDEWVTELRRRQAFDLRPWYHAGEESLREEAVRESIRRLNSQLRERIRRGERAELSPGNVSAHNPHFVGRMRELRRLREVVALGQVGVLTAVHGLGGVGKTALAIEYAHAYADEYGGGRWQVACEGKEDLCAAVAVLAAPLGLTLNEDEQRDTDRQFGRVVAELRRLARAGGTQRCLLILDNVDRPALLSPEQAQRLPAEEWLHVIATTRLGEDELGGGQRNRAFLPVDELPEPDALELIECYRPHGAFADDAERAAALEIVRLLGSFTLAVEMVAVYLGQFAGDVTCAGFLDRLRQEGAEGLDDAGRSTNAGVRHGEKSLALTLAPTLERLAGPERLALRYAALLPPDHVALPWLRLLVAAEFPQVGMDSPPGHPDPWKNVLRRLLGLRLLLLDHGIPPSDRATGHPVARIHRLVQQLLWSEPGAPSAHVQRLSVFLATRAAESARVAPTDLARWELDCMQESAALWLERGLPGAQLTGAGCGSALSQAGRHAAALRVEEATLAACLAGTGGPAASEASCRNALAVTGLALGRYAAAEQHLLRARELAAGDTRRDELELAILTNLGSLYRETCRPVEAAPLVESALELAERKHARHPAEIAHRAINVGLVYQDLGRLPEAIALFRRAVGIDRSVLGERHVTTCQDLSTLAEALRNDAHLLEAEDLLRGALAATDGWGNRRHPTRASLLTNLARVVEDRGDPATARTLLDEALAISVECYGEDSPRLAVCHGNLGANALARRDAGEAAAEFRQSVALEREVTPPNPHRLAHRELNLAVALMIGDELDESRRNLEDAWVHARPFADLLTARVLLARLALALRADEPGGLFAGQLVELTRAGALIAPCMNLEWALMLHLEHAVLPCPVEHRQLLTAMIERVARAAFPHRTHGPESPAGIDARPLETPWPRDLR